MKDADKCVEVTQEPFDPPPGFGPRRWSLRNRRFGVRRDENIAKLNSKR